MVVVPEVLDVACTAKRSWSPPEILMAVSFHHRVQDLMVLSPNTLMPCTGVKDTTCTSRRDYT